MFGEGFVWFRTWLLLGIVHSLGFGDDSGSGVI